VKRFRALGHVSMCWSLALFAGCSSQAGPDYSGEPLLTLKGSVVAGESQSGAFPPANAAVLWYGARALVGASIPVEGTFPSSFTLSLHWPPPENRQDNALPPMTMQHNVTLDRGPLTLGWIVALSPEANQSDVQPGDVLGYALDTMVAYLDRDPDPATPLGQEIIRYAQLWQIPATRGYHLVQLERGDRQAYDQCMWNGLCVDHTASEPSGFQTFVLDALREDYQVCRGALPQAPFCTIHHRRSADEPISAETTACFELEKQHPRRSDCAVPLRHVPASGEAAITITMGATFRDVFM
jgi:hypothetical protein